MFIKHIAHKIYSTIEMGVQAGIGTHVNKGDKSKRSTVARSKTWLSYMLTIFMSNKMKSRQTDYIYNNKKYKKRGKSSRFYDPI